MKRICVFMMMVLALGVSAQAQNKWTVRAGIGVASVEDLNGWDSDANVSWKLGAGYEFRINQLIGIEPCAFLAGKGAKWGDDYSWSPIYLEVPVMCNFHLGDNWIVGAGAYLAPVLADDDMETNTLDGGMKMGARYVFLNGLNLGCDITYGFTDVFDAGRYNGGNHITASLVVGYSF